MCRLDFLDAGKTLVQIRFENITSQRMASSYCITNPMLLKIIKKKVTLFLERGKSLSQIIAKSVTAKH